MGVNSSANRERQKLILCQIWSIYLLLTLGGNNILKELNYRGKTYLVSDTGDIYRNGKLTHPSLNPDGYRWISVEKEDGKKTGLRVARAVAMAFIPNDDPINKTEVNHKDYNRANDCVDNLEWISHGDNVRYSIPNKPDVTGSNNPNYGNRKLSERYRLDPEFALEKQSRKGTRNGRARGIRIFFNESLLGEFNLIRLGCEFINSYFNTSWDVESVRSQINKAIRMKRAYKGLTFEKL